MTVPKRIVQRFCSNENCNNPVNGTRPKPCQSCNWEKMQTKANKKRQKRLEDTLPERLAKEQQRKFEYAKEYNSRPIDWEKVNKQKLNRTPIKPKRLNEILSSKVPYDDRKFSDLVTLADNLHSKFIRLFWTDKEGKGNCYTCNAKVIYKANFDNSADCGHCFNREIMALRFKQENTHLQCQRCNRIENGEIDIYKNKIAEDYGVEELQEMEEIARKSKGRHQKMHRIYLIEIIENRRKEIKEILKFKNFTIKF